MNLLEIPIASALFLGLLAASLVGYLRSRGPLAGGVVLIFAAVSPIFAARLLDAVFGVALPQPVQAASIAGLLAQPLLTLRLAAMLERVPRAGLLVALGGYLLTTLPLILLADPPPPVALAAVAVYAATASTASAYFLRAARRRIGSARLRLFIASSATLLMAVTLLVAGLGAALPVAADVTATAARYGALLAAIGYALAFLTPRWLRRLWQAGTNYELSRRLLTGSAMDDESTTWRRFVDLAAEAAGVRHATLLLGNAAHGGRSAAGTGDLADGETLDPASFGALLSAAETVYQRSTDALPSAVARLVDSPEPRFVTLVSFDAPSSQTAVLVLAGERRSLFAPDDREMLALLGVEAALLADRAAAAAEQIALADRLATTVEALQSASKAKSDFLASMSHELRTPLNAILGFSDLMSAEPLSDGRRSVPAEWVQHIHVAGRHLLSLINDVLDLAKVEAGRLELRSEEVAVDAAVAEALAGLRPLAEQKRLRLSASVELPHLFVDRGRLRQILYNLLSNAIKYTPEGGTVSVEGGLRDAEVRIAVADSGVGIAAEDLERVFDEFTQVGDPDARQTGTGLGLALSRRLVEAHGGRLELESTLGQGSRFTVVLPAPTSTPSAEPGTEPTPAPSSSAAASQPQRTSEPTVLVIEDDPQAIALLRSYLQPSGYRVLAVEDGVSGIAAARSDPPGAILLDVLLPGLDGWEILRRIKADPQLRDIPVLMITVVDEREVGLALGAVDYLVKPIERHALLEALRRHLPAVRSTRPRILAVDDEPAARALVQATLEAEGYEVVLATNGREAIHAAADGRFGLVICDLVMPDIDGFEVIAQLKSAEATRDTPIVVLTGQSLTDADKARLNGKIVGICEKGADAPQRLRAWLSQAAVHDPAAVL